jgi:hypothetical protein
VGKNERNGRRKSRSDLQHAHAPKPGYYFIFTDAKKTEQNYLHGLRNSIPEELQDSDFV